MLLDHNYRHASTSQKRFLSQQMLIRILSNIAFLRSSEAASAVGNITISLPGDFIRMVLAILRILPILIVFPLLQKYFICT